MKVPSFGCEYDEGFFDQDAERWVTAHVCVVQRDGDLVHISRTPRGDHESRDRVLEGRVIGYFKNLGLVKLDVDSLYFDLEKNRLVSGLTSAVVARRSAPGDRFETVRLEAAMALVLRLAALLGQRGPPDRVAFPGWPPFEEHPGLSWSRLALSLHNGRGLELERKHRQFQEPGELDELCIQLDYTGPHAGLEVSPDGICAVEVRGPLELHPQAQAMAERFDWN